MPVKKKQLVPGKLGRPSVYVNDLNELARRVCRLGATNAGLADFFHVDESTINDWIRDKPDFARAVYEGREYSDAHVAECLYQRATGYTVEEEKLFYDRESGDVVRADTLKHYPPDVEAIKHWLHNRQRGKWSKVPDAPEGAIVINGNAQFNDNRKVETVNILTLEEGENEYAKLIGR